MTFKNAIAVLIATASLSACSIMPKPTNLLSAQSQPQQRVKEGASFDQCVDPALPNKLIGLQRLDPALFSTMPDFLGPGDRLRLAVSGDSGTLTGSYVVTANGELMIGDRISMAAAGQSLNATQTELRNLLIGSGLVRNIAGNVRLHLEVAAPVAVSVEGAVFEPGKVRAGERGPEQNSTVLANKATGDFNAGRTLSTALRAAGGLRPDAATDAVYLIRNNTYAAFDLFPALSGGTIMDPQLAAGDRIIVSSTGCFDERLVRPSIVTMPGIKFYMSNLSRPAGSIGRDATNLPYGTRLLQGLVAGNCVGGSAMMASRTAVLMSRSPINGQTFVVRRSIEQLVRDADRDADNPYLMPNDAVACYDSAATSFAEVVGLLGSVVGPMALFKGSSN